MEKYILINEPDKFSYHDSDLLNVSVCENNMTFTADRIGISADNPLNSFGKDMRTEQIILTFENYEINKVKKCGFRTLFQNGEWAEEQDCELNDKEAQEFINRLISFNNWVAVIHDAHGSKNQNGVLFEIELDFETFKNSFYLVEIHCDNLVMKWDEYSDTQWKDCNGERKAEDRD